MSTFPSHLPLKREIHVPTQHTDVARDSSLAENHEAIGILRGFDPDAGIGLDPQQADALSRLYVGYSGLVLRVGRQLLGSHDQAEDVLQEVFAKLPWIIRHYRYGGFGGWIRQVATRLALMRLRSDARLVHGDMVSEAIVDDHVMADLEASEQTEVLRAAIAALPAGLRTVVVLRVFSEHTHDDIASLLGITRSASEVRLCRAVKCLRARLNQGRVAPAKTSTNRAAR
jgi:RNA polymerase sigma factor (sigma-70 family)